MISLTAFDLSSVNSVFSECTMWNRLALGTATESPAPFSAWPRPPVQWVERGQKATPKAFKSFSHFGCLRLLRVFPSTISGRNTCDTYMTYEVTMCVRVSVRASVCVGARLSCFNLCVSWRFCHSMCQGWSVSNIPIVS